MTRPTQNQLVHQQFDPRSQAYLTSQVHANGEDLRQLPELIGANSSQRVLDMGCGGGHVSFRLAPDVDSVTAYDLSPSMLNVVEQEAGRRGLDNIKVQLGSVERMPFIDASFDVVVSRFSAHHWRAWPEALSELARVLKPGGIAVMIDVIAPETPLLDSWLQSFELLRDPSHVRNFSVSQWQQGLQAAGLVIGHFSSAKLPLEFAAWIARMNTPAVQVEAIRALQQQACAEVSEYFAIADDGSFSIDTGLWLAHKSAD